MSSENYIKFGPTPMIVQFGTDRGVWKPQPDKPDGGYFFRSFSDGKRFACLNQDLERRILDLNYRAGEQISIARQTRNRSVMWIVSLLESAPPASSPAPETAVRPAPRPAPKRTPPPLPAAKFAPPPTEWPETQAVAPNGNGHAQKKPNGTAQPAPAPMPSVNAGAAKKNFIQQALFDAVDVAKRTQDYAAEQGFHFTFGAEQIQKIAVSLYIQDGKASNIEQMDRNQQRRAAGGQDPWRN